MGLFLSAAPRPASFERRALTFIAPPIGAYTQALQDYASGDTEGALRQAAVFKCTRLLSDVMGAMKPKVYKGPQQGFGTAVRIQNPVILTNPMAGTGMFSFGYQCMMSLLLRGNVYGEIVAWDKGGKPLQIELKHPDRVKVVEDRNGVIVYKFGQKTMNPEQVWHKKAYEMPGVATGLSPIKYHQKMIELSTTAQSFGLQYFQDGGHPSGILTNNELKNIDPKEAQTIKQRFLAAVHGTREPVVMGAGWQYQQIQIKPDESQFLETQKYTGGQVCGIFGVPPELVAEASEGSAITYANVDSRSVDFLKFGLIGWTERFTEWYGEFLPRGQYVKLDESKLLALDALTRWQINHLKVGSRIMAQDEVREDEDIAPFTEAQLAQVDRLTMPTPPPIGSPKIGS